MSGVCGLFSRGGIPIAANALSAMNEVLAHRGSDQKGEWVRGQVGLGNRLLFTTPESLKERQPWEKDGYCITADARVDNREELAALMGYSLLDLQQWSDSQLILEAYLHWGEVCPKKILGDFAFAIWDPNQQVIFCARDPFGVKPFYYTLNREWFLFGSEIKAIFCHPAASKQLNENWLGNMLIQPDAFNDKVSTFFTAVNRLAPAHTLVVSSATSCLRCYWELDPEKEIRFKKEEDYAEALEEEFSKAVQRRLRSAFPVGSTLSGGIDSSSIACMARNLLAVEGRDPLHTFSAIFKDALDADESPYIAAVVEAGGITPHYLYPDQSSPFVDLERVLWHFDQPFYGTNYFMPWAMYRSAHENGVRVLMDGTDGDTTISHGMDYLDILGKQRSWQKFAQEAQAVSNHFEHPGFASIPNMLYSYGVPHLTDLARRGKWSAFLRDVSEISRLFHISPRKLALNAGIKPLLPKFVVQAIRQLRGHGLPNSVVPPFITPEFAERLRKDGVFKPVDEIPDLEEQKGRSIHFYYLNLGMLPYSLEWINHMASSHSVDVRFPFCDRNLVEFCLALPPEQKLQQGWSRYVMRKAMSGILPAKIQWRGGKTSLAKVYPNSQRRFAVETVTEVLANPPAALKNYLNLTAIQAAFQRSLKEKDYKDLQWVWQTVIIATWMRQTNYASG